MRTKVTLLLSFYVQICILIFLNCASINKNFNEIKQSFAEMKVQYIEFCGHVSSYGGPLKDIPVTIRLTFPLRNTDASNPKVITQTDSAGNFDVKIEKIYEQKGRYSDYYIVINSPLYIAKKKGDPMKDIHFRSVDTTITIAGRNGIKIESLNFYLEPEIGYILNAFNENTGYKSGENLDQAKVLYLEFIPDHQYSKKVNDYMITKEFLKLAEFNFHNHSFDLSYRQFQKIKEWFPGEFKRINMEKQDACQQAMTECRAIVEARSLILEENKVDYVNSLENALVYLDSCAIKFRTYYHDLAPAYILNETERLKDLLFKYVVFNKVCDNDGNIRGNVNKLNKYLQICEGFKERYGNDYYLAEKLNRVTRKIELNLQNEMEQEVFNEILKKYNVQVDTPEEFLDVLKNPYAYQKDYILVRAVVDRFVSPKTAIMRHAEDFFATFDVKIPKDIPPAITIIAKVEGITPGITVLGVPRQFLHLRVVYIRDWN